MARRCMPNSGHGGCPGIRFMIIFESHVQLHISNIGYMKVYDGLLALGGISTFFSRNFTSNAVRIMSWDPFLARVMTIFIKTCILQRLNCVTTTVEKSVNNYVEWYFQSAQRLNFSRLYGYYDNTLYTQYTLVIRVPRSIGI